MPRKILILIVAFIVILLTVASVSTAQGPKATEIAYGDIVRDSVTTANPAVNFRFTGTTGDVIILYVERDYTDSSAPTLDDPVLTLTDPTGFSDEKSGYGSVFMALQLETTGDYSVVVSGDSGSVGNFQLSLVKPEILATSLPVKATITSDQTHYYWVNTPDEVRLSYRRTEGAFSPEVTIITSGDFGIDTVAGMYGNLVEGGSLDVRIPSEGLYFVRVKEALWDFNYNSVDAEYILELVVRKGLPITN